MQMMPTVVWSPSVSQQLLDLCSVRVPRGYVLATYAATWKATVISFDNLAVVVVDVAVLLLLLDVDDGCAKTVDRCRRIPTRT